MRRLPHPFVLLVSAVTTGLLLTGCTSSPSGPDTPAGPSAGSVGSSASGPSGASPSGMSSAASPSSAADALTIDITIKDGQVTPNGQKIDVRKGQTVVERVTSDADDEIHAHTGGDGYELEVKAGKVTTGQFVATDTGSFEIESHHLEKIIAILVVR